MIGATSISSGWPICVLSAGVCLPTPWQMSLINPGFPRVGLDGAQLLLRLSPPLPPLAGSGVVSSVDSGSN